MIVAIFVDIRRIPTSSGRGFDIIALSWCNIYWWRNRRSITDEQYSTAFRSFYRLDDYQRFPYSTIRRFTWRGRLIKKNSDREEDIMCSLHTPTSLMRALPTPRHSPAEVLTCGRCGVLCRPRVIKEAFSQKTNYCSIECYANSCKSTV